MFGDAEFFYERHAERVASVIEPTASAASAAVCLPCAGYNGIFRYLSFKNEAFGSRVCRIRFIEEKNNRAAKL